jgi:hypothetical protein
MRLSLGFQQSSGKYSGILWHPFGGGSIQEDIGSIAGQSGSRRGTSHYQLTVALPLLVTTTDTKGETWDSVLPGTPSTGELCPYSLACLGLHALGAFAVPGPEHAAAASARPVLFLSAGSAARQHVVLPPTLHLLDLDVVMLGQALPAATCA